MLSAFLVGVLLLGSVSCRTPGPPEAVVEEDEAMPYLGPGLRPEILLFPEYLFMDGFELDQHGRIPQSELIGVDLKTSQDLKTVLRRFNHLLVSSGWTISKAEVAAQSFRLLAAMQDETLEVRGVQGSGPTQVFILYRPAAGDKVNNRGDG
jgi:hypothetical protein